MINNQVRNVVRFATLGPLVARRGDVELNLGPVQQRVVLAVLLLHPHQRLSREQLRLWRGPAFEGLSSPLLDVERDRLAEQQIGLLEERIEVDLMVGAARQRWPGRVDRGCDRAVTPRPIARRHRVPWVRVTAVNVPTLPPLVCLSSSILPGMKDTRRCIRAGFGTVALSVSAVRLIRHPGFGPRSAPGCHVPMLLRLLARLGVVGAC